MKRRAFLTTSAHALGALAASRLGALPLKDPPHPLTLTLVGDCILTRKVSQVRDPRFLSLVKLLRESDCALGNCEMTFGEARALEPTPKGQDMNLICPPFGADELAWMGFDLLGCANNHALDYGSAGLRSTLRQLERVGIAAAGAGATLAQAAAPNYADTPAGRVALVNCASSFPAWAVAESARGDSNGRAGVNPLRLETTYRLAPTLFEQLGQIKAALYPKATAGEATASAAPPSSSSQELRFLDHRFVPGPTEILTTLHPGDLVRLTEAVRIARRNARLVSVLIHAHAPARPEGFLQVFAHACIEAGADVVWGAGPHVLGGLELYRGKPICYSLGNFFFQYETLRQIPAGVYEANQLDIHTMDPSVSYDRLGTYFNAPAYWQSVVPRLTFRGGQLAELTLYPITLGMAEPRFARGLPRMATADEGTRILHALRALSAPFGTQIQIRDGVGRVQLAPASDSDDAPPASP